MEAGFLDTGRALDYPFLTTAVTETSSVEPAALASLA